MKLMEIRHLLHILGLLNQILKHKFYYFFINSLYFNTIMIQKNQHFYPITKLLGKSEFSMFLRPCLVQLFWKFVNVVKI